MLKRFASHFFAFVAIFNIGYGALGLLASWYLSSVSGALLSCWVMLSGLILRIAQRSIIPKLRPWKDLMLRAIDDSVEPRSGRSPQWTH